MAAMALATILTAALAAAADVTERTERTLPWPADAVLIVEASNAAVRITGSTRADLAVSITRTVPSHADLDRLPAVIEAEPGRVRVAVRQSGTDPALRSTIAIELPRLAAIESIRVDEGRLDLAHLAGRTTADVRRGPIVADDLTGTVRLETGIGDLTVRGARLAGDGLLRLRTFNGDIDLSFAAAPSDARVLALALNGTVTSTLPLTLKTGWGPRWGEATIGRGEPVVSLDVVRGDIRLTAPPSR